jgi:hypothetical protein
MTSFRQIDANRRNARLSTGPKTEEGKSRSRRNAVRHGLTAETVIDALESAEDYATFQMAVTSDYDARTAVERELLLRLASLFWRLRRATAIETGLFKTQAEHLHQFRNRRRAPQGDQPSGASVHRLTIAPENDEERGGQTFGRDNGSLIDSEPSAKSNDLTQSFVRLSNLPTYPLDRLSRYEATLWRQACQILFTLRCSDRRL